MSLGKYNGSLHYMDPEYEITGGLTRKSDVFSYGVVLFEVLLGREASSIENNDSLYFVRTARSHYEDGKLDDLIDPDLRKQMNLESVNIFAETAYCCIKEKRSERQNMNQVLSKLEEALKLQYKHENPLGAESALLSNYLKLHRSNQQGSTLITNNIAGTNIYLDPEYHSTGKLKTKSDIYSLGVVMFEIMCGKLAYHKSYGQNGLPSIARQCFIEGTLNNLIDHRITEVNEDVLIQNGGINQDSLVTFIKVAHQCLAKTQLKRPTMKVVIQELEKALNFQITNKNNPRISLEAIILGTHTFSCSNCIGEGSFWKLYKGEIELANGRTKVIAKRWDTKSIQGPIEFSRELYILSRYRHESIIGLVGYCNEGNENIIVYENASNGILSSHLGDPSLTWMKRLKICIDIAKVLTLLNIGDEEHNDSIIHRHINSASILLDDEWNAKVSNFEVSCKTEMNKEVEDGDTDSLTSLDIEAYKNWGYLTKGTDIHSLGVILIEMLCGRLAWVEGCEDHSQSLCSLVARHYDENKTLDGMIFEDIKEQVVPILSNKFVGIAIQCLQHDKAKQPRANWVVDQLQEILEFQKLHISLKAITLATQNFNEYKCVGEGRLWKLYEGEIKHANASIPIMVKQWNKNVDETHILFSKELDNFFDCVTYKSENIIGLVGFCNEDNERIIVFNHASNGILEKYLGDPSLTWIKRLKIGIDVVNGLSDIDTCKVGYKDVIRSRDILLDDNWNARIYNLDGYMISPKGTNVLQRLSDIDKWKASYKEYIGSDGIAMYSNFDGYSNVAHPSGMELVYKCRHSISVILIEMLCGSLPWEKECYKEYGETLGLSSLFKKIKLEDMIFEGIKEQIAPKSLIRYQATALKCLLGNSPPYCQYDEFVAELKDALKLQEDYESKLPIKYKELNPTKCLDFDSSSTRNDLNNKLSKGTLFQDGKVFLSVGSNGERIELISSRKFSYKTPSLHKYHSIEGSSVNYKVKHEEVDNLVEEQQDLKSELKTNKRTNDKMFHAKDVVHNPFEVAIQSRLDGAIQFVRKQVFHIKCNIQSDIFLSSKKENACYLVFKLSDKFCGLHGPVVVRDLFCQRKKETRVIYFRPQKPWNLHDHADSLPNKRKDGWKEVVVWRYDASYKLIWRNNTNYELKEHLIVRLKLVTYEGTMEGLIVRNIEFR
ncbi:hypothetical protein QVD17_35405 [Tagetes erecta]|uniref:Protein kinase domain-containing protein n=1 Tax=Tagetes erecta TaxID=13708 RepID=A0AAD8NL71_TARER|nr:hypothetical protein QVD17_35405 [Tagetes erecta]